MNSALHFLVDELSDVCLLLQEGHTESSLAKAKFPQRIYIFERSEVC